MITFKTLAEAQAAFNTLETSAAATVALLATANEQNVTSAQAHSTLTASLADAIAQRNTAQASLATITTERDGLIASAATKDGEIVALKAAATTVNAEAARILAASGHRPLNLTQNGEEQTGKTVTRAEFDKMGQYARSAFFKAGGRIVDNK